MIRQLFRIGGLTILTASVTMFVVGMSTLGISVEEFRLYSLGYFSGTFISMIFTPQFSFIVIQFGCSQAERLKMRLVSVLIVSLIVAGSLIFKFANPDSIAAAGFLTGSVLSCGIYLNTETFAVALRRQELKYFFWVRLGTIIIPVILWGAVFLFLNALTALLSFEISRGVLLILISFRKIVILWWQLRLTEVSISVEMLKIMAPRHVIKLCEAVLIVLFPFLIMLNMTETVVPIRIGFQAGMMLGGIVGIVVVPRILRSERFSHMLAPIIYIATVAITFTFLTVGVINWYIQSDLFVAYSIGAALFIVVPILGICGALVLKFRGGWAVATVWMGAVAVFLIFSTLFPMSFYQFVGGLWSISFGYSLIVQFLSPAGEITPTVK